MNADPVGSEVRDFLEPFIEDTDFSDEDDIFELGLVNSLMAMQLLLFLEKRYQIKFAGDELDIANFRSLNRMRDLVARKLEGAD